ncbi:hypothetical protein L226DRAFT_312713 [Lentinus tigrinus ALCF2SS1-7]|uniref:Uncharacterized protein n=1 Tax=Lentinus tigrinus ALCF2SS1-6 TaxID=1328759 RepID=A0A5C2RSJ4_9APHY|nr:hypothetical protein L227DRAFT_370892 [Lentinus tigrinus ALCF2SS1-6]RPD68894.1 hypothetical protein L226DRAFT_312713 [Lentinus tigrinus ALCF2SS1-7]
MMLSAQYSSTHASRLIHAPSPAQHDTHNVNEAANLVMPANSRCRCRSFGVGLLSVLAPARRRRDQLRLSSPPPPPPPHLPPCVVQKGAHCTTHTVRQAPDAPALCRCRYGQLPSSCHDARAAGGRRHARYLRQVTSDALSPLARMGPPCTYLFVPLFAVRCSMPASEPPKPDARCAMRDVMCVLICSGG